MNLFIARIVPAYKSNNWDLLHLIQQTKTIHRNEMRVKVKAIKIIRTANKNTATCQKKRKNQIAINFIISYLFIFFLHLILVWLGLLNIDLSVILEKEKKSHSIIIKYIIKIPALLLSASTYFISFFHYRFSFTSFSLNRLIFVMRLVFLTILNHYWMHYSWNSSNELFLFFFFYFLFYFRVLNKNRCFDRLKYIWILSKNENIFIQRRLKNRSNKWYSL